MSPKSPRLYCHLMPSPLGRLLLVVDSTGALVRISFAREGETKHLSDGLEPNKYACGQVALELDEYFRGKRRRFDCSLRIEGTDFQKMVWSILFRTRYGETLSYSELAGLCGKPRAVRAVANAVASNPLPIVVPCHRILPRSGGIGNYALHQVPQEEGCRMKKFLLDLEQPGP